jgi:hypothetical protein
MDQFRDEHLHGAASQKTAFFIVTAVKTSNLTQFRDGQLLMKDSAHVS